MTNQPAMGKTGKRRITILLSTIVALIVLISAIWFFVAYKVEGFIDQAIEAHNEKDHEFNCNDRDMTGYPFRIGIRCSSIAASFKDGTTSLTAGELRTAAQIYQPGKVVGELDGPLTMNTIDGETVEGNWDLARLGFKVTLGGELARLAMQFDKPRFSVGLPVNLDGSSTLPLTLSAKGAEFYSRQGEVEGSVDLAGRIAAMALDFPPGTMMLEEGTNQKEVKVQPVDATVNLNLEDVAPVVMSGGSLEDHVRQFGLSGQLRQFAIQPEKGGSLELSGPFSINQQGLLSGKLELKFSELARMIAFLASIQPELGKDIEKFMPFVEGLAKKQKGSKDGEGKGKEVHVYSLPLIIKNGHIVIGILPAGQIPPLFES